MSGDYETHNDRQPNITYAPRELATYHIYLNDKCLFKNLNESDFLNNLGELSIPSDES